FASYMMTEWSRPVGELLPKAEIGVFAWRMLSISTLVIALLIAACVQATLEAAKQGRKLESAFLCSLTLCVLLGGVGFSWREVIEPSYNSPAFAPAAEHMNLAMQPRSSQCDVFKLPRVEPAVLAGGKGHVSIERWEPQHRVIQVELSEADRLLIRTFNFPGWTAAVDGAAVDIINGRVLLARPDGEEEYVVRDANYAASRTAEGDAAGDAEFQLGDMAIDLRQGAHTVTLDYRDTPTRRAAGIITLFSIFVLAAMVFAPPMLRSRR
ncbi:MAG: hypothetical protein ACLGJB_22915, partial [Blastocatellia bacterium]